VPSYEYLPHIEVLGTSGAGKTTILNAVSRLWSDEEEWLLDPQYADIGPWIEPILPESSGDFIRDNESFVAMMFRALAASGSQTQDRIVASKFLRSGAICKVFAKIESANKHRGSRKLFILDEGFVKHAGFLLDPHYSGKKPQEVLSIPQMPKAYIFIETNPEVIAKRLQERGQVNTRIHWGLSYDELLERTKSNIQTLTMRRNIIKESGIPLITIDSSQAPEENAGTIISFTKDVADNL
jgi:adenylate kinase